MRNFYIFLILVFIYCGRETQNTNKDESQIKTIPVKVARVEQTTIAETVKITGEIIPLYQLDIYPRANGIITSEEVTLGSKVQKDQVLAKMRQDVPGMEFSLVKIEATNNGVITMDAVEIGATVSVQRPVYTISKLEQVYMEARLIESLLGKVNIGESVTIEVDAYPEKKFNGKIKEISPIVDRISRTAGTRILVSNQKLLLKPGMFATAYLKVGSHSGLMVPIDAIVRSGASNYIFCIKDGKTEQISIETNIVIGNSIEINGAIQAGDQVVILGQNLLEDGTPVRIAEEP